MKGKASRRFVWSVLTVGFLIGGPILAQGPSSPSPKPIPWIELEDGESAVGFALTGDELPQYLVIDTLYEHLLYGLGQGGGTWTYQVLGTLGIAEGSKAEAELEDLLLEARVAVREVMHKHVDRFKEPEAFQAEQQVFLQRKMAALATVHAELLGLLARHGIGTGGLDAYIAEQILPSTTFFVAADAGGLKSSLHLFSAFDEMLQQRLRGEAIRFPKSLAKSNPVDAILVTAGKNFTPCGEGLQTPKGQHSTKVISIFKGYRATIAGSLDRCYAGIYFPTEDACSQGIELPSAGSVVSCTTQGADERCGPNFRAYSRGQLQRNGALPLTQTNTTSCSSC